jgi:allantoinase
VAALRQKREAAAGKLWVDVGFHGGVVPGNADHIEPLIAEGVCAFKAFLCHSGIDEFPNATESDLRAVMPTLAAAGVPLFVHAELVSPLPHKIERRFEAYPRSYATYLATRPPEWEVAAIRLLIDLCREYRCPVHIVHLAAAKEARPLLVHARAEGLPITVETCPHYVYFSAEDIPDGKPLFKCAPPIRPVEENGQLRTMIVAGQIDTLGSDHSPAPPAMKFVATGNLRQAWGGIASLQLLLPVVWTALGDLCGPARLVSLLATRPAALVGLSGRKGAIAPARDADLVVFNPDAGFVVSRTYHRHPLTPYYGRTLFGTVETTYLRGRKVYDSDRLVGEPCGHPLNRHGP